jgi:hypothetical protein
MRICIMIIGAVILVGCENPPSTMRQRQDNALRDPMNYSPRNADQTDISGGGVLDFKKDAFKRDVNSVFNP